MYFATLGLLLAVSASASPPDSLRPGVYRRGVATPEGGSITLHRYVPEQVGQSSPPVVLVPDFGFAREVFDLSGRGLALFLQASGREVFVVEIRPGATSGLARFVRRDLMTAFDAVARERLGRVDVVAHGFSGTWVLAASTRELRGRIRSVVALSTPVEAEIPNPKAQRVLERGGYLPVLAESRDGREVLEMLFARRGVFPRGVLRELWRSGLSPIGDRFSDDLLSWMRTGDFAVSPDDSLTARLTSFDRPTLLFLPMANNWAHPEFAAPLRELAPRADVTLVPLNRVEFVREDYTHLSMLLGVDAPDDVWAPILRFLLKQDRNPRDGIPHPGPLPEGEGDSR